jgi:DNA-binding transcriptional regulator YiaG
MTVLVNDDPSYPLLGTLPHPDQCGNECAAGSVAVRPRRQPIEHAAAHGPPLREEATARASITGRAHPTGRRGVRSVEDHTVTAAELRQRRLALALGSHRLARVLGASTTAYVNWEHGRAPVPAWVEAKLAEIEATRWPRRDGPPPERR